MKQLIYIALTAAWMWLGCMDMHAQPSSNEGLTVHVGIDTLRCEFTMGRLSVSYPVEGYALLQSPSLPHQTIEVHNPTLPMVNQLVVIPEGGRIAINIETDETQMLQLSDLGCHLPLLPVSEAISRNQPQSKPSANESIYKADSFYHPPLVSLTPLGIMRGQRIARLSIAPVEYNAQRGSLRIHRHVRVTITFPESDHHATLQSWQQGVSPFFPNLTGKQIASPQPIHYLIVSRPRFAEGLQPFVEWKRQQGYVVEQLLIDTNSRDTLFDRLQARFNASTFTCPPPTFILLVGDNDQLQSGRARHRISGFSSHPTDLYFAEYTGDYLPDALIGRWPVADTSQLRAVVEKTLQYEQYRLDDTAYLNRVLLVAGNESRDVAPVVTNGQVNYVKSQLMLANAAIDTACFYHPNSIDQHDDIFLQWQQGVGLISYSGHSFSSGWFHPTIGLSDIDSLSANGQYSLVINNCCLSNQFQGNCFGSHLLKKEHGGAIGCIGASNETLWNEDFYWAVGAKQPLSLQPSYDAHQLGAFDRWIHTHQEPSSQWALTQGEILLSGNMAVSQYGSPYDAFYWEVYHLMGDPSLMPYLGIPSEMTVEFASSPVCGSTQLSFIGTAGALVSLMQDTLALGSTILDAQGNGTIQLRHPLSADSLLLTATAQNRRPIIRRHAVLSSPDARVAATEIRLSNNSNALTALQSQQLQVVVTNFGQSSAIQHNWVIHSDDIAITPSVYPLDTLLPQQSDTLLFTVFSPLHPFVNHVSLTMADSCHEGYFSEQTVTFDLLQPEVVIDSTVILLGDVAAHSLMGDTTYTLYITLRNTGPVDVDSVTMNLIAQDNDSWVEGTATQPFNLAADATHTATFTIHTADSLQALNLQVSIQYGGIDRIYPLYYLAGQASETFERGNFTAYPWDTCHPNPWHIVSDTVHHGRFAMRSDSILGRQTSAITLPLYINATDSIRFFVRTSSEADADKVGFAIDGVNRGTWSGIQDWQQVTIPITAGHHLLQWSYTKGDETDAGSDCGWVDDILLPLCRWSNTNIGYPYWVGHIDDSTVSIANTISPSPVRLYPNPAHDCVTLDLGSPSAYRSIAVYDTQGVLCDSFETKSRSVIQYSTHHLRLGVYTFVISGSQGTKVLRLVIQ
ncbi:MAG: T9SS type A sorting domain-containing protein [Bacteroidales bacterium]|nr:T9SS type A sorting domain-containing protein [Bacteroidales bacterium]